MDVLIAASVLLVIGVSVVHMGRGRSWGESVREGARWIGWVYGMTILFCGMTYFSGDPVAALVTTLVVIAWLVLCRRPTPTGSPAMPSGRAAGLAKVVAGTGNPAIFR